MKNILILIFTFISLSLYSNEDSTKVEMPSTTQEVERLIDKYGSKTVEYFENAVESVTPIAEDAFFVVVRLKIAEGIAYLLIIPLLVVCAIFAYRCYKIAYHDKPSFWPEGKLGGIGAFLCIASVILFILMPFAVYEGLIHIIAPEWFAIKEIFELIK